MVVSFFMRVSLVRHVKVKNFGKVCVNFFTNEIFTQILCDFFLNEIFHTGFILFVGRECTRA